MKKIFELINKNLSQLIFNFKKKSNIKKELPLITISREKGSGGKIIAGLVVKKLGKKWRLYHKEIIEKMAKESHLEKQLLKEVDEKKLSLVDEIIADFFGKKYLSLTKYQKILIKTIARISQQGYAVIVGRGAEYIVPHALKVRIICDMEQRISWLMQYENITRNKAIEVIEKSDKERYEFIKALYNHDIRKAHHYDLVIKTSKDLSLEDAASLIVLMAKRRFKL